MITYSIIGHFHAFKITLCYAMFQQKIFTTRERSDHYVGDVVEELTTVPWSGSTVLRDDFISFRV